MSCRSRRYRLQQTEEDREDRKLCFDVNSIFSTSEVIEWKAISFIRQDDVYTSSIRGGNNGCKSSPIRHITPRLPEGIAGTATAACQGGVAERRER